MKALCKMRKQSYSAQAGCSVGRWAEVNEGPCNLFNWPKDQSMHQPFDHGTVLLHASQSSPWKMKASLQDVPSALPGAQKEAPHEPVEELPSLSELPQLHGSPLCMPVTSTQTAAATSDKTGSVGSSLAASDDGSV